MKEGLSNSRPAGGLKSDPSTIFCLERCSYRKLYEQESGAELFTKESCDSAKEIFPTSPLQGDCGLAAMAVVYLAERNSQ